MSRSKAKLIVLATSLLLGICFLTWRFEIESYLSSINVADTGFAPDADFKGQLAVTIIERLTSPERHLRYLIDLGRGKISTAPNSDISPGTLSPGGSIDNCNFWKKVEITAPSGELVADCIVESTDGKSLGYYVRIRNEESNEAVREWAEEKGWDLDGLVWSDDSGSVAVLSEKERMDFGLVGLVSMTSGHPIPLETFKVTLLSVHSGRELRLPVIRKDSPSGWARLDWIQ